MAVVERSVETALGIGAVLMDILKIASRLKERNEASDWHAPRVIEPKFKKRRQTR
jgi:hypothetical protein